MLAIRCLLESANVLLVQNAKAAKSVAATALIGQASAAPPVPAPRARPWLAVLAGRFPLSRANARLTKKNAIYLMPRPAAPLLLIAALAANATA